MADDVIETLRRMSVLEGFTEDQLEWVRDHGEAVDLPAGSKAYKEGDTDTGFWLLMSGSIELWRSAEGVATTSGPTDWLGAWGGQVPLTGEPALTTLKVLTDARFWRLPNAAADEMVGGGFPIARHIITGLQIGTERMQAKLRERDRLSALGRLSAGLAHELNNPAAAAGRAAVQLRDALVEQVAAALALVGEEDLCRAETALAERITEPAKPLSAMARGDREDQVADWLDGYGVPEAWDAAAVLVDSGVDVAWLDTHLAAPLTSIGRDRAAAAVRVLTSSAAAHQLAADIAEATGRMSELVGAIKGYSNMDGSTLRDLDIHDGIESTLVMLAYRLRGVTIVKEYGEDLPAVRGNQGELNQVWTNLLDNAGDALGGTGTITIRTRAWNDVVVVEVIDDGPGMAPDVAERVFEPFYTTKDVGAGTGMGLDMARRIVTDHHSGTIGIFTTPGKGTTVRVMLPVAPTAHGPATASLMA